MQQDGLAPFDRPHAIEDRRDRVEQLCLLEARSRDAGRDRIERRVRLSKISQRPHRVGVSKHADFVLGHQRVGERADQVRHLCAEEPVDRLIPTAAFDQHRQRDRRVLDVGGDVALPDAACIDGEVLRTQVRDQVAQRILDRDHDRARHGRDRHDRAQRRNEDDSHAVTATRTERSLTPRAMRRMPPTIA